MTMTMKMARVGAGLTQQQVADKMGIHVQTYLKMEKDSDGVTIREAKLFSEIVGVAWSEIFFGMNRIKFEKGGSDVESRSID